MVWHFGRQFKQSKDVVRNCVGIHSVKILDCITDAHYVITGDRLRSNRHIHLALGALFFID